jgi:3-oxoacyl-[acyl-carrier-protein] synthase-3
MNCYISATGAHLPGNPVSNKEIPTYLGNLEHEDAIREKILRMNGIQSRHYALDQDQNATADLYALATEAAVKCLSGVRSPDPITYLSSGTTNAPLLGPGPSSLIHDRLSKSGLLNGPVEISSHSGICASSAQALLGAIRAVKSGEHHCGLAIGVDQPSDILKSSVVRPPQDRESDPDIRKTGWFMSVFLRSMLSDGAGAMLLSRKPVAGRINFQVNWTYSRSFAHLAPLCMRLENRSLLLSQDVVRLENHMKPCAQQALHSALEENEDCLSSYSMILPHLSSFYFKRLLLHALKCPKYGSSPPHWTNLKTAGNTGAASIYIMLDEYIRTEAIQSGDRLLLFIPESGQFNFALVSLTCVTP